MPISLCFRSQCRIRSRRRDVDVRDAARRALWAGGRRRPRRGIAVDEGQSDVLGCARCVCCERCERRRKVGCFRPLRPARDTPTATRRWITHSAYPHEKGFTVTPGPATTTMSRRVFHRLSTADGDGYLHRSIVVHTAFTSPSTAPFGVGRVCALRSATGVSLSASRRRRPAVRSVAAPGDRVPSRRRVCGASAVWCRRCGPAPGAVRDSAENFVGPQR